MYFVVDRNVRLAPAESRSLWRHLWELRDLAPIIAVRPAAASSACPLLADEAATSFDFASYRPIPVASAWVNDAIDLSDYSRCNGDLRVAALEAALRTSVARSDRRHDEIDWATTELAADSNMNRRLSIFVRGWGCLMRMRGADPAALSTLRDAEQLADFIVDTLCTASRELARARGHCPALDASAVRVADLGAEFSAHWRRALAENALRHRNLVTMSPWDLFPRGEPADPRYADLLPLISRANTVSFLREVDVSHWNVCEFRSFHDRVGALLERRSDTQAIAKPV